MYIRLLFFGIQVGFFSHFPLDISCLGKGTKSYGLFFTAPLPRGIILSVRRVPRRGDVAVFRLLHEVVENIFRTPLLLYFSLKSL